MITSRVFIFSALLLLMLAYSVVLLDAQVVASGGTEDQVEHKTNDALLPPVAGNTNDSAVYCFEHLIFQIISLFFQFF